jgi:hypothetical protein
MEKQEASKKLSELVAEAKQALFDACDFAQEHGLSFTFEPTYGMGGTFNGNDVGKTNEYGEESDGWYASSLSC